MMMLRIPLLQFIIKDSYRVNFTSQHVFTYLRTFCFFMYPVVGWTHRLDVPCSKPLILPV